jgi:glutamate-1-semialdehyde 2,1-aminomutase
MATLFFHEGPVRSFEEAAASDTDRYGAWFRHLLARGVYVAPSQFEALFVSTAHGEPEIDATVEAARELFGG